MIAGFMVGPSILMYHAISDTSDDPFSVSVTDFRAQLSWLHDSGFAVVSLEFLLRSLRERNVKALRKKVVITFDDGYSDFSSAALPLLLEYGANATVFLVTDRLGERASWGNPARGERLMSENDIRSIKNRGMTLGSHSATHANLTLLDRDELERQLKDSRDTLTRLGESFPAFSYPWGQWSHQVADAVKAAGYTCAVAVGGLTRLDNANCYHLPRLAMRRDMDLKQFRRHLTRPACAVELRRKFRLLRGERPGCLAEPMG